MPHDSHFTDSLLRKCHIVALALVTLCSASAYAQGPQRSFVIRAGTVLPVTRDGESRYSPGMVMVRDGKIVAVGADLPVPVDLELIDLPDAVVMPGLVAASTSLTPQHTGDESIAAGYRAVDSYLPYADYRATLAGGVTTVHLDPGRHRLVTGQGAVVKLGGPLDGRILMPTADLTMTFGESAYHPPKDVTYQMPSSSDVAIPMPVRQRPDSRMGQVLAFEEALARSEPQEFTAWHLATLARLWQDRVLLRVQVDRGADMAEAIAFLKRYQRRAYFVGGAQADLLHGAIRSAGIPVVFELGAGLRNDVDDLGPDRMCWRPTSERSARWTA